MSLHSDTSTSGTAPEPLHETVGHRLRTHLHTILGYAGLVRSASTGEAYEQLGLVEDSAKAMLALIDQLPVQHLPQVASRPASPAATTHARGGPMSWPAPPTSELAHFGQLLQFGRLIQIEQWATQRMLVAPEWVATAQHVAMLARSANLPELEQLLQHWRLKASR